MSFIFFLFGLHFINGGKQIVFLLSEILVLQSHDALDLSEAFFDLFGRLTLNDLIFWLILLQLYRGHIMRSNLMELGKSVILIGLVLWVQKITVFSLMHSYFATIFLRVIILLDTLLVFMLSGHKLLGSATWGFS